MFGRDFFAVLFGHDCKKQELAVLSNPGSRYLAGLKGSYQLAILEKKYNQGIKLTARKGCALFGKTFWRGSLYLSLGNIMLTHLDINSNCFLCKKTNEVTEEHVFPQWLQHDFNLREQFILLLNGTKFQYKSLKVPCCSECNNKHLSNIENKISKIIRSNDIESIKINRDDIFIWLYKIMYGLHYKEMFLKKNIKNPLSESIVSKNEFFERHSYNLFPLYARKAIIFDGFQPYSLFIFRLSEELNGRYFYADEPNVMFSSIVLGNIGIVCSFQCDGYIENDIIKKLNIEQFETLTLAQFGDLCAFVIHLKTRMKKLPNYICHTDSGRIVFRMQQQEDDRHYSDFDIKKQLEFTIKIYKPLFDNLITTDVGGQHTINYKSPYRYF